MQVQDLRRWHWMVLAIFAGIALGYVYSQMEVGERLPTIGQADFERGIMTDPRQEGRVEHVQVLPPVDGKYKVLCAQWRREEADPRVLDSRAVAFTAESPYKPSPWRGDSKTYANVLEYLKAVKAQNAGVVFEYAWYRETWAIYTLWIATSLLLIGGVWPSVVSLMTGGGLGLAREAKEAEYDLERFGRDRKPEPAKAVAAKGVSQEDEDQLRRVEEELERNLAGGATVGAAAAPTGAASGQSVRELSGGPMESSQGEGEELVRKYGGEFYPVVKAVHKKGEEPDEAEKPPG